MADYGQGWDGQDHTAKPGSDAWDGQSVGRGRVTKADRDALIRPLRSAAPPSRGGSDDEPAVEVTGGYARGQQKEPLNVRAVYRKRVGF